MPATYGFHPEALFEYAEAANYYLAEASVRVADSFVSDVEAAVASLVDAPTRWPVVEEPAVRRYVFHHSPSLSTTRWETQSERVTIYAVMHCSREPGYWHHRIERNA